MTGPGDARARLREVALQKAIEYHAKNAEHNRSKGPAGPATVTASAEEFLRFLADTAAEAGVTAADR